MDALIANRHSCRRYQDRSVDPGMIWDMISRLANAPNGGNKQQVEFTLIDDRAKMERFRRIAFQEMEILAGKGIYPEGFDRDYYEDMKRWRAQCVRICFLRSPASSDPTCAPGKGRTGAGCADSGNIF